MSNQSGSSQLDQDELKLIVKELIQEPTLVERWKVFCTELGLTDPCVTQWSSEYKRGNLHPYDLFMNILKSWQSEKGDAATKDSLWETLSNVDKVLEREYSQKMKTQSSRGSIFLVYLGFFVVVVAMIYRNNENQDQGTSAVFIDERPETTCGVWYNVGTLNKHFVGRQSKLNKLEEIYSSRSDKIVLISGLGGIGKSELAKKFAHDLYAKGVVSVTSLNGESEASFQQSLMSLAHSLGIPTEDPSGKVYGSHQLFNDVAELMSRNLTVKSWLLIFDNVDDLQPDLLACLQLINETEDTFTILTSRNRSIAEEDWKLIELDEWEMEDAIEFVKRSLGPEEDDFIVQLCDKLQNHALAIQQAVAYIIQQRRNCIKGKFYSLSDYIHEFDTGGRKTSQLLDHELSKTSHKFAETTFVTWDITLVKIKDTQGEVGPLACYILDRIAYFDPTGIQLEFLGKCLGAIEESMPNFSFWEKLKDFFVRQENTAKSSEDLVERAVELLKAYSLIKVEHKVIFIHRLVQEVIRLKLNSLGAEFSLLESLIVVIEKFPQFSRSELAHVLSVWKYSSKHENLIRKFPHVPIRIFNRLYDFGLISEMFNFATLNYTRFKEVLGEDNLFTLVMKHNLARALDEKGEWEKSLQIYKEVWDKEKEILGEEHKDTLVTAHNMASILLKLNRLPEAEELWEKVWESRKKTLGENHPHTMNTKHNLAYLLSQKGEVNVALGMYNEVLEWEKEKLGERHPHTLFTRHSIANCLLRQGNYLEAKEILEVVWECSKAELGEEHPDTIKCMRLLVVTLCNFPGEEEKALEILQQVLILEKKIRGVNHPFTLQTEQWVQELERIIGTR